MKKVLKRLAKFSAAVAGYMKQSLHPIQSDSKRILTRVADEGYETAYDILFPKEETRGEKLHFGPVIPG